MKFTKEEQKIIDAAKEIIDSKYAKGEQIREIGDAKDYFKLHLTTDYETFNVMFLDTQLRVIAIEELSRGTIDRGSVYPREVAKRSLELNCSSVIFAHNHPSGVSRPSDADIKITYALVKALDVFGINVLEHLIIGKEEPENISKHMSWVK